MRALVFILTMSVMLVPGQALTRSAKDEGAKNETSVQWVEHHYQQQKAHYAEDEKKLVRRGVLADADKRRVTVLGEAIGLGANEIAEFIVVGESSSHDYEALIRSFANPSQIEAALEWIGMPAGESASPSEMRFWAKGETLDLFYQPLDDSREPKHVEQLVIHPETKESIPQKGFIFCKLKRYQTQEGTTRVYADDFDPCSIAATYNESNSLLDLPYRATKSETYENCVAAPGEHLKEGQRLKLIFVPRLPPGETDIREFTLNVKGGITPALAACKATLEKEERPGSVAKTLKNAILELRRCAERGQTPFLSVTIDKDVPLQACVELAKLLRKIEDGRGVKLNPPTDDQLYYQTYLPENEFRDRMRRNAQPWELHLKQEGKKTKAELVQITQKWKRDELKPELIPKTYPINAARSLSSRIETLKNKQSIPVLFVYADPAMQHGDLMRYLIPMKTKTPTMYLFLNRPNSSHDG